MELLETMIHEIQSELEALKKDTALDEESNFAGRVEAIDVIECDILDRIDGLLATTAQPEELLTLKRAAAELQQRLEAMNHRLFQRLRAGIRTGAYRGAALKTLIDAYVGEAAQANSQHDAVGYDKLDLFINGLLLDQAIPAETKEREPEMVYYQKTPARIMFELIENADFTQQDLFYDLGSGLGHIPILVHLISGVQARGIEFEPAYCDYARACAEELKLSGVAFINIDARHADYSAGTVFFMYTPFEGSMLQEVLERLRGAALQRKIRLFTYGPCTPVVAQQGWLQRVDQHGRNLYKLGAFRSL